MQRKIKLLSITPELYGVGHYRIIWPSQSIQKHFSDEFEVEITQNPNVNNLDYLCSFDIIQFHRTLCSYEGMESLCKELRSRGVILIMDLDDYWEPSQHHPLYELVKNEKMSEKIVKNLTLVDYVTTTTDIFAEHIKKYNKNVFVIPNAIDPSNKMWASEVEKNREDLCRISWIGGSSHYYDLKLMENDIRMIYNNKELKDKFQFILCGFDTRGTVTEQFEDGSQKTRPIRPEETIWCKFEQIFTANYDGLNDHSEYANWLKKVVKTGYQDEYSKPYVRRWTLPLTQYGKHYDYCDVCLAPLEEKELIKSISGDRWRTNYFNEVKSELKIIEAGMKKKVLIAQDFGIYKELIKNDENGILVNSKDKNGWYKAIKKVINDKEYRERLANNLHSFVMNNYQLDNVTKKRTDFYKSVLVNKNVLA